MGCGTGILAIMAEKLGAREVLAIDVEPWTVENARDNAQENHCRTIECRLGGAEAAGRRSALWHYSGEHQPQCFAGRHGRLRAAATQREPNFIQWVLRGRFS
ncbi:MAG: 50S ribosomal protein L11 methyltransferase [Hymenobacter sp.]